MAKGFLYFAAVLDWHSRYVLSWQLSNPLDVGFCLRALAALTERQPLAELAAHYQLAPAQISRWKLHLRQQAAQVFAEAPAPATPLPDVEPLYTAIGRLQMENALLKKTLGPCQYPSNGPWSRRRTRPTAR